MENNNRLFSGTSFTILLVTCIVAISVASLQYGSKKTAERQNSKEDRKGFAVVELFTSEGCAYCPPAHELLAKIQRDNPDKKIYALAYHVDFWDNNKWKDRFSNAQHSKRQLSYARWLNVPSVYAPQVVVNGKGEFAGTDESKIQGFIKETLIKPSKAVLSIQGTQDEGKLVLNYQVGGGLENSHLQVAIVKKSSDGTVEEGKDKGHLFTHVQTVRGFHSSSLAKDGKGISVIKLPEGFNSKDWEVIAMIQNLDNTGEILAATRVNL